MSSEKADVRSIDAIERFRIKLIDFIDIGSSSLTEAESDIEKCIGWLQNDRIPHWTRQIRKRQELLTRAKGDLYRKQMQSTSKDGKPSVVDEKRALRRAEERLNEAQRRMQLSKRWTRTLEREFALYKGGVSGFSTAVERDLPHAAGLLKKMTENLEKYLALSPPDLSRLLAPESPAKEDVSNMKRHGSDSADITKEPS